nr:reverse transcriptase domain-containing protein [Tanacetum cinerariifolium]
MTNERETAPPPGFSTPPHIPNVNTNNRTPITTIVFATTTPGNTLFVYYASTLTDPALMISPAFVEDNYEILESLLRDRQGVAGFEEALKRERSRIGRNIEGNGPSKAKAKENGRREMNLPSLLAAHLGRNEDGQPLGYSLTSIHGGRQSSIYTGGNLPPNGTLLSHHAQPFIPNSVPVPNGFIPTHITTYFQPSAGIINGQTPSFLFPAQTGNPSVEGAYTYPPQIRNVPQTSPNGNIPLYNGSAYHVPAPTNNYPFYTQPMYTLPNTYVCPNPYPAGLFADPTRSVTPFVCWIKEYPLPDGQKMPSHVGSYNGKGDPDNFLHLFEGAIHMKKWIMPVTYSKRSSQKRTWHFTTSNKEKARVSELSPLDNRETCPSSAIFTKTMDRTLMVTENQGARLKKVDSQVLLVGFSRENSWAIREVLLEITICNAPLTRSETLKFVIVRLDSSYNMSLGRTTMQKIGMVVSTIHEAVKFHTNQGIRTVFSTHESKK